MEINNGWVKWQEIGETLDVELKGVQFNKNGNPYAVCNRLDPLPEGASGIIKFNISKTDVGLKQGRYTVKVVSINNGFGYVEFKPLQDTSWDIHDEHLELAENTAPIEEIVKSIPEEVLVQQEDEIIETLNMIHKLEQSMTYRNGEINHYINEIKKVLYLKLGEIVVMNYDS